MNRFGKLHAALLALLVWPVTGVGQGVEIHRCLQEDGTVAFQETPCPEPAQAEDGDGRSDSESNANDGATREAFSDPETFMVDESESPAPISMRRAKCEKTTRDAIDAIDEEIRKDPASEARDAYLGELLELTRQLRACKQL